MVGWWINGTHTVTRTRDANGTEYRADDNGPNEGVRGILGGPEFRDDLAGATNADVSTVGRPVQIRISIVPGIRGYEIPGGINVTNRTTIITMTEDGRIETYRAEFTGHLAGEPETTVTGRHVVRFVAFGETTVERPDWVANATTM